MSNAPLKETGRQRVLGIPLNYHKRLDWLQWTKLILVAVALIAASGWAIYAAMRPERSFSPGHVAGVHATWDAQCAACHESGSPVRDDAVNFFGATARAADAKCQACHLAPQHHEFKSPNDAVGCSVCHQEHLGKDADIARTANQQCLRCHDNLANHAPVAVTGCGPFAFARVTDFNLHEHPQFGAAHKKLKDPCAPKNEDEAKEPAALNDPGKLKFSHRRHLAPGLRLGPDDRFAGLQFSAARTDLERYRRKDQDFGAAVQLDCNACHQLDAGDLKTVAEGDLKTAAQNSPADPRSLQPSAGAYMLPINYENHCSTCHPLSYPRSPNPADPFELMPHGLLPAEIQRFLRASSTEAYLSESKNFTPAAPKRPLPGEAEEAPPGMKQAIDEQANRADTFLRGRCIECHTMDGMPSTSDVIKTQVPSVWFDKARFDHSAHHAVQCKVCHDKCYLYEPWQANTKPPSLDNEDVLLPKLDACVQCHGPRNANGTGGARSDCVECHLYHGGEHPRAGPGAAARGVVEPRWNAADFLRGVKAAEPPGKHAP